MTTEAEADEIEKGLTKGERDLLLFAAAWKEPEVTCTSGDARYRLPSLVAKGLGEQTAHAMPGRRGAHDRFRINDLGRLVARRSEERK